MTFADVIINLIIGLVTGGLSGYIVSRYFRKDQDYRDWLLEFENDKQNLENFLYAIRIEMDILRDAVTNGETIDVKDAKRIFSSHARTLSFADNLTEESYEKQIKARNLIEEIENNISTDITLREIRDYSKELFKARIDIVSLKSTKTKKAS